MRTAYDLPTHDHESVAFDFGWVPGSRGSDGEPDELLEENVPTPPALDAEEAHDRATLAPPDFTEESIMAATKRSTSRKRPTTSSSSKRSSGRRYGKKAVSKVEKAMHERKHGTLRSGSGKKVKSRKQAIAIGLNEARKAGGEVPRKRSSSSRRKSR